MALSDAFVDATLEKELFDERKSQLLLERQQLEENLAAQAGGQERLLNQLQNYLELAGDAWLSYTAASVDEKRQMLADLTSNWTVEGKSASVELRFPFQKITASRLVLDCPQERDRHRKASEETKAVADTLIRRLNT